MLSRIGMSHPNQPEDQIFKNNGLGNSVISHRVAAGCFF
ncbi:Uncharacterised protein [Klebsiella pneumoniae]|nr:Uncharacterised protein [Klebsiella pneumoniae]VEC05357.1 Uncharacterised protein [Klebsiella pneumoniae]